MQINRRLNSPNKAKKIEIEYPEIDGSLLGPVVVFYMQIFLLEMSYDGRRNLGACKSNYIAIQSCFVEKLGSRPGTCIQNCMGVPII